MSNEKEIVEGWARVAADYKPRPLNPLERRQLEQSELAEEQAKRTPFVLGQPLYSKLKETP